MGRLEAAATAERAGQAVELMAAEAASAQKDLELKELEEKAKSTVRDFLAGKIDSKGNKI